MSKGTPHKCFRCDDDLWDAFGAIARARGTNRPDLLRDFIAAYVEEFGTPPRDVTTDVTDVPR